MERARNGLKGASANPDMMLVALFSDNKHTRNPMRYHFYL